MENENLIATAFLVLLGLVAVVYARQHVFNLTQKATVTSSTPTFTFDVYIDGVKQTSGTTLNWGNIARGTPATRELDVKYTGNSEAKIWLGYDNPDYEAELMDLSWMKNGLNVNGTTVRNAGDWVNGTLTSGISSTTPLGTYTWDTGLAALSP